MTLPYSRSNVARICSSLMPASTIFNSSSRTGPEEWQFCMLHSVMLAPQPHWHMSILPRERTCGLASVTLPVRSAPDMRTTTARLFLSGSLFGIDADHLRTSIGQFDLVRHQTGERSEEDNPEAEPDTGNQRVDVDLDNGVAGLGLAHAGEIQIKILVQPPADGHLRGRLLRSDENAALGLEVAEVVAVLVGCHDRALPGVVRRGTVGHFLHLQVIMADRETVAHLHLARGVLVERGAGEADKHQHDSHVDEIAA